LEHNIRKARENEKLRIAQTIAYSFEKDFSGLAKDMECIAKVLENGLDTSRFLVAEQDGKIVGVIACSDCTGRALNITKKDCKNHLGFIRGFIAFQVFYEEFLKPLTYPQTTCYMEVLGVLKEARGQGIGKAMLEKIITVNSGYSEYILNVVENNINAIRIYENFGFVEYERIPYKWAKQSGIKAKIWMRYTQTR